ncbi:putative uncharacterized protein YbcY 2 [Colletotrichum chlorophyti]|uniref:Uncharacterized protein n=1 Tax=Colletotrichum chlorophyti TaxID=708187 RepID=A0A1Q8RAF5_9PEZI|nr:putative uncharacterized protein YbcY 2 [Colletotrichum chlorophyti]
MTFQNTAAGAAIYGPLHLRYIYDPIVLGFYCPCAWQISSTELRHFFNRNIRNAAARSAARDPYGQTVTGSGKAAEAGSSASCRLLDIGVGTGYFLKHAPIPAGSEVYLADLNPAALHVAGTRTLQAHPKTACKTSLADFLDPYGRGLSCKDLDGGGMDAISAMLLLHCVPGPPDRKAEALVRLRYLLALDGTLFGATILGRDVKHNLMGKTLMFWHNLLGVFGNREDDVESFIIPLKGAFENVRWEVCGKMLLFEASRPKP